MKVSEELDLVAQAMPEELLREALKRVARKTVVSIYWGDLRMERPFFTPKNRFEMKGVERGGKPQLLVVTNVEEIVRHPGEITTRETIYADQLAEDMINEWSIRAALATETARPGIMACKHDTPDKHELQRLEDMQAAYAEILVNKGDQYYSDIKTAQFVTDGMRAAAKWLNVSRPWLIERRGKETQKCRYCSTDIPATAVVCPQCKNVADPAAFAVLEAEREIRLAQTLAERRTAPAAATTR